MTGEKVYVVVTLNPSRDYYWEIHAHGCRDLEKSEGKHGYKSYQETITATSVKDVIHQHLDPETEELGYSADSYKVLPCTKNAPLVCPV